MVWVTNPEVRLILYQNFQRNFRTKSFPGYFLAAKFQATPQGWLMIGDRILDTDHSWMG